VDALRAELEAAVTSLTDSHAAVREGATKMGTDLSARMANLEAAVTRRLDEFVHRLDALSAIVTVLDSQARTRVLGSRR